ncbi:VanZ family protein [Neobacillus niacini]|uniref:VanZ family protein n=1 Tax=Neobacillus niacini TaxID=86668 RepID=UPI001C8D11A9|nr:VanZ family protein [Neobacillus niacini]MBY0145109.1 VanZ family protein [Neobacillus niacini]
MGKRKWWLVAAIVWMISIFIVTQLPYFTGQNTAKVIQKAVVTDTMSIEYTSPDPVDIKELNLIVRKATHFIVFGILAFLLFKAFESYRFSYILAWMLTVLYALLDEWHQSFMPGRVATYRDVLFDSFGAFVALAVLYMIRKNRVNLSK